ncbi:MAG: MarR family winged helix-turn-helix transcriptional regulator [Desulfobacterales bacterium]|nr:MarR family winged helix-turn-helix transcriptional regulator [Desulfobacterales bacterium]
MTETDIHTIHKKFFNIVKLMVELEKTPRHFGTDELLTSTEIRLIEAIGDNGETDSVTELANLLGVTKGAVSQNLKKTEKRGLTTKDEDPENLSRSIVGLTSKGKTAYYAHKHWHETMDGGFKHYFTEMNQAQLDFLHEVLSKIETFLKSAMQ